MQTDSDTTVFLLSGHNRAELLAAVEGSLAQLKAGFIPQETSTIADHSERLAIVAPRAELPERLILARQRLLTLKRPRLVIRKKGIYLGSGAAPGKTAFLFPGQGSQYPGMLQDLYEQLPFARAWFDSLDAAYQRAGKPPPTRLIYRHEGVDPHEKQLLDDALLDMREGAQLGTVANLVLFEGITRLGIQADVMVGHSNGEHAAVIAAGMLPLKERERLCAAFCRLGLAGGRLARPSRPEGMITVSGMKPEQTAELLAPYAGDLFLAMDNCPHQQVLAGREIALDAAMQQIIASGGICIKLAFGRAYHTPLFADWAHTLAAWYDQLPLAMANDPVYSCLTGRSMPREPAAVRDLMTQQWTAAVRFRETIESLFQAGIDTFIEVGPDGKLTGFVEDILRGRPHLAVNSSSRQRADILQLRHMLAALHVHGLTVEPLRLRQLTADEHPPLTVSQPPALPTAAIASNRTIAAPGWQAMVNVHRGLITQAKNGQERVAAQIQRLTRVESAALTQSTPAHYPLLGTQVRAEGAQQITERTFSISNDPFVTDHSLGRQPAVGSGTFPLPVLAFTTSLEIIAEAAQRWAGRPAAVFTNLRAHRWLALDGGALTVRTETEQLGTAVNIRLFESSAVPGPAFEGTAHWASAKPPGADLFPLEANAAPPARWNAARFYQHYAFHGPSFQGLARVLGVGAQSIEAELRVTDIPGIAPHTLQLDPALLDCAGQLVAFWLLEYKHRPPSFGIFPYAARRVTRYRRFPPTGSSIRCRGHLALQPGGVTEASFVFMLSDSQPIATIEGFAQRLVEFPQPLARRIFAGETAELSQAVDISPARIARRIDIDEWLLLTESWGIWARALAHLVLTPQERAVWLQLSQDVDTRCRWLLTRLAVKEAVSSWAAQQGIQPLDMAEIEIDAALNIHSRQLALQQPVLELTRHDNSIVATVTSQEAVRSAGSKEYKKDRTRGE